MGPASVCAVIVREEEGVVTSDERGGLHLNGKPFEDDPRRQADELLADVTGKLAQSDKPLGYVICFTRARIDDRGNPEPLNGVATLWTLAWTLTDGEENLNAAEVGEFADLIPELYGRPPFVTAHDNRLGDEV